MLKKLSILGTRGIPAQYGGFETFAERLALYLASRGWQVSVYCESEDKAGKEYWQKIELVHVSVPARTPLMSILFDWKSTQQAAREQGLILVLGYNTAIFSLWYRLKGKINLMNMDGLEWKRQKWKLWQKAWLYINEKMGCWLANHVIADHPVMQDHLSQLISPHKITMIPYGTEPILSANTELLKPYQLLPNQYALIVARPEPENSILEIVAAFSQKKRGCKLVVLGRYLPEDFSYHKKVLETASEEILFLGSIYNQPTLQSLRFYTRLYIHGHQVGGTNPSLVEALSASSPVLAHENPFNCWVAGKNAHYFKNEEDCADQLEQLLNNEEELQKMKQASWERYQAAFANQLDLQAYENLLLSFLRTNSKQSNQANQD
jgi:glycosyltransferase involved in cell wall biosynthesis